MPAVQERLLDQVDSVAKVTTLYQKVKQKYPAFPRDACAATLSVLLQEAGVSVPFQTWAQTLVDILEDRGWKVIPVNQGAQAGDVFVCVDGNGNHATDHVGIVVTPGATHFKAADNQMEDHGKQPYQRNVGPGPKTRVNYWLRAPEAPSKKILVSSNGVLIQNARAFQNQQGRTFGAIRPIATAMGWTILEVDGGKLDLEVKGTVHQLEFTLLDGRGFVALGDLRPFCSVTFDGGEMTVELAA